MAPEPSFEKARASARVAGYSLSKVGRWLHEVALKQIDPATGLYRADGQWNYQDTAADCYPFLVWAAYLLDEAALDGPVRKVLEAEQRLCNHIDRIPVPYDFDKRGKNTSLPFERALFGATEYAKDGLVPIVELTGRGAWLERMIAIEEDIWKHAPVETPYGKIPSRDVEVNGDQLLVLTRLYAMTGDRRFLEWAERLADYYLGSGEFVPRVLIAHGGEIVDGLALLVGLESEVNPQKARHYAPLVRRMLDSVLARGVNEDGFVFTQTAAEPGRRDVPLADTWGYTYIAYLCYDMATGQSVYRPRIEQLLRNLAKPRYNEGYPWVDRTIDGFADACEGAMYLLNRVPQPEGFVWLDSQMATHVARSSDPLETARLWGTHKLESNAVRTVIMHALMHTRGLIARPWRRDLRLGACQSDGQLAVVMTAEQPWSGRLVFDIPRHRLNLGFQHDWPRLNQLPEWFTVEPERNYSVRNLTTGETRSLTGRLLHDGLPVEMQAGEEVRLLVRH